MGGRAGGQYLFVLNIEDALAALLANLRYYGLAVAICVESMQAGAGWSSNVASECRVFAICMPQVIISGPENPVAATACRSGRLPTTDIVIIFQGAA